ncbi:2-phosphosulfolactate phosphatase [Hathewaya proteolytica DSM 3090]|uniref:Probable 2-phosphosulfolactate phosphatase n=1 Tax=Hathewaya proteolytica DSM 3090 TaxID=1121331 RepID=A0A1M6MEP2_9CLOT|nr:2-phosphosulfolactate phosphatase [Hathewaya proteolytica]SHJ81907.1 2-phosphosulfolactate phosphatase [Hathewaya proteolytica DSM 3090]
MKIDIVISKKYIDGEYLKNKTAVVIDMLRATSVMVTALKNGAKSVIPVVEVDQAFQRTKQRDLKNESKDTGEYILGGERKALKIHGFHCSNSPLEYTEDVVKGKTVIMTTSNGTAAINRSLTAEHIIIGAMINGRAVAEKCLGLNKDVVIINSGTNDEFSMDDFICGGYIIHEMMKNMKDLQLTDIAMTALDLYNAHPHIDSCISRAKHYGILKNLGLEEDLKYCMQKSITDVVPCVQGEYVC